jgi:hypothetical protein
VAGKAGTEGVRVGAGGGDPAAGWLASGLTAGVGVTLAPGVAEAVGGGLPGAAVGWRVGSAVGWGVGSVPGPRVAVGATGGDAEGRTAVIGLGRPAEPDGAPGTPKAPTARANVARTRFTIPRATIRRAR